VEKRRPSINAWAVLIYTSSCTPHLEALTGQQNKLSQVEYTLEKISIKGIQVLDHDEYIIFKARARKHMPATLLAFIFWGQVIGRIRGQIKEKFGQATWYADLGVPASLHEIVYSSDRSSRLTVYNWDPSKGLFFRILDVINNISKLSPLFLCIFVVHKLFFYNVAHWVAIVKNPDCAMDIVECASHPKKILFKKFFIKLGTIIHSCKK
jgi:hypothetical protein